MLEKLQKINVSLMEHYKNDEKNLKIQKTISKILETEDCFFKMSIEQAFSILRELKIPKKDFEKIYLLLTMPKN